MISVVVPAYNCELYLDQAIKSVQAQTLQDFEVIIVDDGSTDNTLQLAKKLADNDSRIKVLTQENSGGPAIPRNQGIGNSIGEFVAFLDPDDYWYPKKLERQLEVFLHHLDIDIVFGEADLVDHKGNILGKFLSRVDYFRKAEPYLIPDGNHVYISKQSFYKFTSVYIAGPQTSGVMLRRSAINNSLANSDPHILGEPTLNGVV